MNNIYYSYSELSKTATIYLKIKATANSNNIEHFISIHGKYMLKLNIIASPQDGKANIAIIKILAKIWGLKQEQLEIIKGHNIPFKILAIKNITKDKIEKLIASYVRISGI